MLNKQLLEKPDYWNILRSDEMTKYIIDKFEEEITSKQIEPETEYTICDWCGLNVNSKRYNLGNWVYAKDEHPVSPNGDFKTESIQADGKFGEILILKSCLRKGSFPKLHRGKVNGKNTIIESFIPLPLKESTPDSWYKKSKPIEVLSLGGGMDSCTEVIRNGDFYDIIIMSDTGAEEYETHAYLEKWFFPKLKNGHMLLAPLENTSNPACAMFVKEANKIPQEIDIGNLLD